MKSFVAFALLVAAVWAAPPSSLDKDAVVVRSDFQNIGVEGYQFAHESSNGIAAQEQGQLKNVGTENEALEVRGQFSYIGPDGVNYAVTYVANEQGFQPSGVHLPVGPSA